MSGPARGELLAVASVLLSVALATLAFYPSPSPALLASAAGTLIAYAAAAYAPGGRLGAVLLALTIALAAAAAAPFPPSSFLLQMAMAAALALAARTRGGAIALASVVAFSTNQPALPIVAAAASIVASWRTRRAHELLLPSGYLAASLAGFLGYPMTSALLSLAASAAAAAYLGRGLSTCPFRTDRTMYTIGLAAISALALASPLLPPAIAAAMSAGSLYVLASGLLAPAQRDRPKGV
jgi:hypothetical protein